MDLAEFAECDAVGLAALLRAGEVSADEVENAARSAIAEVDLTLHATVGDLLEPPLEAAADGPLGGVPFALKEVAPHLEGQVSQLGCRWTANGIKGAADTYLGQRIRAAGLRVIARTRSPEFAFNATTEPLAHGPTRSPWDLERSAGGSSGGAAALVAARALPMAHGTDGGGSLRIPASLCGLVALKPSRLRIPVGPALWEANHGMAHDFVLCRTLRDAAAALDAFHGPAPGEKYVIPQPERPFAEEVGADPGRLRIAWTTAAWSGEPVAPECRNAVGTVAQALDGLGHDVEAGGPTIDADVLHRALLTCWATGLAQRAALLERAIGTPPSEDTVEACTLAMIRQGGSVSAVELLDGYGDCNAVGRSIGAFFEAVDVLLLPTVAKIPWKLGELDQNDASLDTDGWVHKLFSQYVPFTAMFNITGQPAISLPLAWGENGLPIGVQLVARYADEATLLRLASQLEELFPWAGRAPRIAVGAAAARTGVSRP
jgi:amidase